MAMVAEHTLQEDELVRRVQAGDEAAFDRLVDCCASRVYALAYRLLGNADDAQDLAQEAFVHIYQAIGKFRNDAAFSTWLYRIVLNTCLDELAKRKRRPLAFIELENNDNAPPLPEQCSDELTPEEVFLRRERQQAIQHALTLIPEQSRLVIILCDFQGLSYQETSEVLKVSLGTMKSRLNRARLQLREKILQTSELFEVESRQTT